MSEEPVSTKNDYGADFLRNSFAAEQKVLKAKLEFSRKSITHAGEKGEVHERHFIDTLRRYLPNRYSVDSGIILDSTGATSDQIDVIIYDRQYTPTLLDQQNHKYVPAEAVYGVLEVKPEINASYLEYAGKKAASVRKLHRTSAPVPHSDGTKKPKPPFPIIGGIVAAEMGWAHGFGGEAFKDNWDKLQPEERLDCGLAVVGHTFDLFDQDGAINIAAGDNALVHFLFRLLKKLQELGTVPAVEWSVYAETLSKD